MGFIGFYVIAFVLTFILGGIQQAAGLTEKSVVHPQLGPGLAALLMLLVFRKYGHRLYILDRGVPASRYFLAVLIPAGAALAVYLINSLAMDAISFGDLKDIPWFLIFWMPLGAFGEELGWRGYLHKRLNIGLNGLVSTAIAGVLWALWHVGSYQNGALYMAFFVLATVSYTFVIHALVADVGFNVLVATVFHFTINIVNLFSYSIINDVDFMVVNGLVWVVIAAVVVLMRKRLFLTRLQPS